VIHINSKEIHMADTIPDRSCIKRETDHLLATLTTAERRWISENDENPLAIRARSLMAMNAAIHDDPALQGELCGVIEQIIKTKAAYKTGLFRRAQRALDKRQMGDVLQNHICWLECEMIKANEECNRSRYEFLMSIYEHLRNDVLRRP